MEASEWKGLADRLQAVPATRQPTLGLTPGPVPTYYHPTPRHVPKIRNSDVIHARGAQAATSTVFDVYGNDVAFAVALSIRGEQVRFAPENSRLTSLR